MGKIRRGDGSPLKPVTGIQWLWRGQFGIDHDAITYALDVNYFDFAEECYPYEDGTQVAGASLPAKFPVAGGQIEADMSLYGMRRAHLVTKERVHSLTPSAGTAERWRTGLEQARPGLSRRIAIASAIVLIAALLIELPQLLQVLTGADWFGALAGWSFAAPFSLPSWVNAVVGALAVVAGLERALRLKHNWLLDE